MQGRMQGDVYEGETIYESSPSRMSPTPSRIKATPEMAPMEEMPMKQTRRNMPHPASYREDVRPARDYEQSYAGRGAMPVYEEGPSVMRSRQSQAQARAKGPIVW